MQDQEQNKSERLDAMVAIADSAIAQGRAFRLQQAESRRARGRFVKWHRLSWNREKRRALASEIRRVESLPPLQLRRLCQDLAIPVTVSFEINGEAGNRLRPLADLVADVQAAFPKLEAPAPIAWHGFKKWSKARVEAWHKNAEKQNADRVTRERLRWERGPGRWYTEAHC